MNLHVRMYIGVVKSVGLAVCRYICSCSCNARGACKSISCGLVHATVMRSDSKLLFTLGAPISLMKCDLLGAGVH